MSEKTSVKLTMGERFNLLSLLPKEGDYTTVKILRKLRETLSPDEKENEEYDFQLGYRCPERKCAFTAIAKEAPECPEHKMRCISSGQIHWKLELANKEKEVWLGKKAKSIIESTVKLLNDTGKLKDEDGTARLYEKFIGTGEEDE
jgi:hypothetical protein